MADRLHKLDPHWSCFADDQRLNIPAVLRQRRTAKSLAVVFHCRGPSWQLQQIHTHVIETELDALGLDVLVGGLVRPSLLHSLPPPPRTQTRISTGQHCVTTSPHSNSAYLLLVEEDVGRALPLLADVRAARLEDLRVVEGEPAVRQLTRVFARVNAVADVVS